MPRCKVIPYRTHNHGSFEEEWLLHKGCSEWWYATGYLEDENKNLYSFQYTLIRARVGLLHPYILMLALTDFKNEKHYYSKKLTMSRSDLKVDETAAAFGNLALAEKKNDGIRCSGQNPDFSFDLFLGYGKGAVWHCDNGVLQMGIPGKKETTFYFTWPNMPTAGTITFAGKTLNVTGKSWFDRQGGTYHIANKECHWEWFSLRFFDDEEIMLFSFPQDDYRDGTYILKDGSYSRLNEYSIKPLEFVYPEGLKFSSGWDVSVPGVKDEKYIIKPLLEGQLNLVYFELLAGIYREDGTQVGMCFVELLPGVYNDSFGKLKNLMSQTE